ncbi:hypothetical protein FHS96_003092 [Sphingomonas zeicaulis]|uniref:hypothetical protein n=1 Tax=Sphingomonas zeicaulis TaxID=1632740 RepID=UPI003D1BD7CC
MTVISTVARWLGVHRGLITLLLLASIGGAMYVAWQHVAGERDAYRRWIDVACASAGKGYDDVLAAGVRNGEPVTVKVAPGAECNRAIGALAAFRRDSDAATAATLAEAMQSRDAKLATDAAAARRDAAAARAATERMEKADAQISADDRVGADWFDALNDLAGLRRNNP